MHAGALLAILNLLNMGGGGAPEDTGGLVCGSAILRPLVSATAATVARIAATADLSPRVLATAELDEC